MINFPSPPLSPGYIHTANNRSWEWNGATWDAVNGGATGLQGIQGIQGVQGTQGTQGLQGTVGSFGGAAFDYLFNTATGDVNPGSGKIIFNNSDATLATVMRISYTDALAVSIYNFLQTIDDSTSNIKGHFTVTKKTDTNNYGMFAITGYHNEHVDHFDVPIAFISGAPSFTNDLEIIATFARTGDKGDTGSQGTQGIQGIQGTQGAQGEQGIQGIQGIQGVQGTQGTQGIQGRQGIQGIQGTQGVQGTQGTQGIQGIQGNNGIQGTQGTQGIQGLQGITGAQGATGSQGTQGIQGLQGITGSQGTQGTQGLQGTQGTQGLQGIQGIQGTVGSQGITGIQGSVGAQGTQGIQGIQGRQGIQGSVGTNGTNGTNGSNGAQGAQGTVGSTGAGGSNGGTGAQGAQGAAGATGATGSTGGTGATGAQGTSGATIDNTDRTLKSLRFTGVGGDSGNGAVFDSYAIYQQGGGWTHPYPDLCIGYHTGIKIGAYLGYGGTRFYNNSDWATEIFSVGNGDNHVRAAYNFIAGGTVTAYSDIKLKDNVITIGSALDKVDRLRGVYYTLKDDSTKTRRIGVIAQEIQQVLPEVVLEDVNKITDVSTLSVAYGNITALLIEAIKELKAEVAELKSKL